MELWIAHRDKNTRETKDRYNYYYISESNKHHVFCCTNETILREEKALIYYRYLSIFLNFRLVNKIPLIKYPNVSKINISLHQRNQDNRLDLESSKSRNYLQSYQTIHTKKFILYISVILLMYKFTT